jgi:bifunctional DNA-binding transcriptional regulator/antitoxin component of YhaV-PrlF toxin-antitoxin module
VADVKLTSKRQATLPAQLCDDLGVEPGDRLRVERRIVDGEPVWVLSARLPDWSWFGAAKAYGREKSHRWEAVEESIARGWARGDRS